MTKKIILDPYIDYDGVLTQAERKKILNRLESAFSWIGATIPEEIKLDGDKFKLREEIQKLILKPELSSRENRRIEKLISSLETSKENFINKIKNDKIPDYDALELSNQVCGLLRAVHELREIIKKAPSETAKVMDAKTELMKDIEDKKRWMKYIDKIK